MGDFYLNYAELAAHEQEGRDYRINLSGAGCSVLIIAPHGGRIEPFTTEIACWIAGEEFAWYSFEGLKEGSDNRRLHITSHNFDEPKLLQALQQAEIVLTVHGLKNSSEEFLMIGGLDLLLGTELKTALQQQGVEVKRSEQKYSGVRPTNICNRGRTGKGVQLEMSYALRKRVCEDSEYRKKFVKTVKSILHSRNR